MAEELLRIAICDDTPMEAELLAARLEEYARAPGHPQVLVQIFCDAAALGQSLAAGQGFDLAIMDIVLPGQDGLSFVRGLRGTGQNLPVAFLSNSPEYDGEARALGALACLTKPVKRGPLFAVLDACWNAMAQAPPPEELEARDGSRFAAADIVFAERNAEGALCHLVGGGVALCDVDSPGLVRWLARPNVARVTRELAVDMDKIASFTPKAMTMTGGAHIKIPWTKQREWAARYMEYMAHR